MNRCVPFLLAACAVPAAVAQMGNGPAAPPSPASGAPQMSTQQEGQPSAIVDAESDGKCRDARPGDTVNFALTIEGVDTARAVYGELQMREGHSVPVRSGALPLPDFRNLAGGGLGSRDPQKSTLYRFSFRVPTQLYGGVYRGVAVLVTTDRPVTRTDRDHAVEVTHHTREEVKNYCLHVMSGFGGDGRPVVTDFQPGTVEKQAPAPLPQPQR